MLDEIKQSYYEHANIIKDWKKFDGNQLCYKYIELKNNNDPYLDNYLSAIVYRFWNVAVKAYYAQGIKLASPEEFYNWLIDSIQYVLEHHVWTDPNHKLFNDLKAPEKAINVVFNSTKINYFVAQTRQKRKIDATSISLDSISEDVSDAYFLPVMDNYNFIENDFNQLIIRLYKNYNYFGSICLDLLINEDLVDNSDDVSLKYKKLRWRLKQLDKNYAKLFSALYGFKYDDVFKSVSYISSLDTSELDIRINKLIKELKHNNLIKDLLN